MRFLLTSWGSRGDLHPFLALGRGLLARGHQVTLVGHSLWREETESTGIRFVSTNDPTGENFVRDHPEIFSRKWGGLVSLRALVKLAIAPSLDHILAALLAEAPNHDILVAHHFSFAAPAAAELTGLPWATVTLAPGVVPSAWSLPGANFGRAGTGLLGRASNSFVWGVGKGITRRIVDPEINQFRARHGLKPVQDAVFEALSPRLNLQLYSEHFAPRPPDWSAEKRYGGFCFFDPPGSPSLPPVVEQFLKKGDPPVLATLGSTVVNRPGAFFKTAAEAIGALGLRGILLIGPEQNRPPRLPDSILALPYAPYGLLMPRVRAVVHQCGIGTLSHTLRAGVPSLACPFAFDQPNNARRLETLGVAEVISPSCHTALQLERALKKLLACDAPARARQLGELIRAEGGVGRACSVLEEIFAEAKKQRRS